MGICSVHSIVLHGDAILPAVFTSFGKLSMIVDYMVLQGIWHGKRFTTIFTFIAFMMILFHVMLIHSKGVVNNITNVALHVGAILKY